MVLDNLDDFRDIYRTMYDTMTMYDKINKM